MGKYKNWQIIIFTALITTILSVCGSMTFYSFTNRNEVINNAASETYVDSKVHAEKTERKIEDNKLQKDITKLQENKADKMDVNEMKQTLKTMDERIYEIWKDLKRNK